MARERVGEGVFEPVDALGAHAEGPGERRGTPSPRRGPGLARPTRGHIMPKKPQPPAQYDPATAKTYPPSRDIFDYGEDDDIIVDGGWWMG